MIKRLLVAPFIVLAGTVLALQSMFVEANAHEKDIIVQNIKLGSYQNTEALVVKKLRPAAFGLEAIDTFAGITSILQEQGYQVIEERMRISCFTPVDLTCSHLSDGDALYVSKESPNKRLAVTYKHKMTLKGCMPAVNQMFLVESELGRDAP